MDNELIDETNILNIAYQKYNEMLTIIKELCNFCHTIMRISSQSS